MFDCMSEVVTNSELIRRGFLLPTKVIAPSEPDVDGVVFAENKVRMSGGDYSQTDLAVKVKQCTVFGDVWKTWEPFADRKTIVFAPTRDYCQEIAEQFNARLGEGAAHVIDCDTQYVERRDILQDMRTGNGRVLCSVDVLREGFDMPEASCAIDLQPTRQLRVHVQKLGRIKRPCEGQEFAVLLDMAGNVWRNYYHPDDNPEWPTGKTKTREVQEKKREKKELQLCTYCRSAYLNLGECPECGTVAFKTVRKIRMGDGTMREIEVKDVKAKKKKSEEQRQWDKARARAVYNNMTAKQAIVLYHQQTGEWPPSGLDYFPEQHERSHRANELWPWLDRRRHAAHV